MWVALGLVKEADVGMPGRIVKLPISDMAEGCAGCLLVFETKEAAEKYAGEGCEILRVNFKKKPA